MQLFKIHNESRKLTKLQTLEDLCFYLECDKFRLQLNALKPVYYQYKIRKNKVSFRQIEDPADELKKMQRKLNDGLQAVYYYQRPPAVFGFCINTNHETERNIVTNARQHVKARSLLNIDLKDFFHQISKSKVKQIYESVQPRLDNETSDCVASLCTFKGRLPMGAPTSPVLSNFACIELDTELVALCRNMGLTYTRYADDLSFSGVNDISPEDKELIEDTIKAHRFIINPDKVRLFAEGEIKTITGLQIRDGQVKLPEKYYHLLRLEINRLQHTKEVENRYHTGMSQKKLKLMEQEIMGKLNFARMVPGELEIKEELEFQFAKALEPPDEAESANWLDFPYIF